MPLDPAGTGVWIFDETDSQPTASQLLNLLTTSLRNLVGSWQSYNPGLAGASLGNGTIAGRYRKMGGLVFGRVLLTLGSTSSVTGSLFIGLPVNASLVAVDTGFQGTTSIGTVRAFDTSASAYWGGTVVLHDENEMRFFADPATATTGPGVTVDNDYPWTWATGDKLAATFCYEAA